MDKFSKEEVGYARGHKDSHCGKTHDEDKGYCKHFIQHNNTCRLVEGKISPVYWCKKWQKA
jgi:hypothetical protein